MMLPKILTVLGLSGKESALVAALIKRRSARASLLAEDTKLPRQTVYSILEKLVSEGVISATSGRGVREFACDEQHLIRHTEDRIKRLRAARDSLQSGEKPLVSNESSRHRLPSVVYYEGAIGLERLFRSMLELFRKGKVRHFRGYGINFLAETKGLEDFIRYFLRERARLGVNANLFVAKGPNDFRISDETSRLRRTIKHLDIDEQNAGAYMVGNRLYLFSYKDNVGVMVENPAIVALLRNAFDDHWEKSS